MTLKWSQSRLLLLVSPLFYIPRALYCGRQKLRCDAVYSGRQKPTASTFRVGNYYCTVGPFLLRRLHPTPLKQNTIQKPFQACKSLLHKICSSNQEQQSAAGRSNCLPKFTSTRPEMWATGGSVNTAKRIAHSCDLPPR
jgi:hypothetical protein